MCDKLFDITQSKSTSPEQELHWWIEVSMQNPESQMCFGPYETYREAELDLAGFVEDLSEEGVTNMVVTIQRCRLQSLTLVDVA